VFAVFQRYIILIDEEVIVTEAFLEYMCKVSDFMKGNDVIGAASAWNPYGEHQSC